MSKYDALIACYQSGQISEAQWAAHLLDPLFAQFVCRLQQDTSTSKPVTNDA
jgi:hypothetical protein